MGSIHVRGDVRNQEEKAREIEWERNKLYIHLAARNNPGTFHWSLYLTEERPEVGWMYHVFDPEPDRWILEMAGGDEEGEGEGEEEKEKENIPAGGGEDSSGGSESPGEETGGDGEQPLVDPEEENTDSQEEQTASKKNEEKRKREARDTGHSSDESSDETAPWESATSLHDQEDDRKYKKPKTVHWKDQEPNASSNDLEDAPPGNPHAASIDESHVHAPPSSSSSSLLAAVEIGTDVQDMRTIIEQTIATEWETGRKKIAKGDKICREFLLKCVEELESLGVLSFKHGKGVGDVEREAEEFGLLSDPALNKGARKGRVWKSRVVE